MNNFLRSRTWEDWTVYIIVGILMLGGILFIVGFLFNFELGEYFSRTSKTSINKMLFGSDDSWTLFIQDTDTKNLFTLMGSLPKGTAYNMCATAVSGFAIIMFDIALFFGILIYGMIVELVLPRFKKEEKINHD